MNRFYVTAVTILKPIVRLLFPCKVEGLKNLAAGEKMVLCANHASAWDPVLICISLPKTFRIRMMAKKELMDIPVLGWIIKKLGAFGIDRGNADLAALKTAIKAVKDGENLLVFPEGTRVDKEGDARAKGGVVMIAMRTGALLVPVSVGGRKRLFKKTRIVFGEPYLPQSASKRPTAEEFQAYADEVLHRAYALGREE